MPGINCYISKARLESKPSFAKDFLARQSEYYVNLHATECMLDEHVYLVTNSSASYKVAEMRFGDWIVFLETQQPTVPEKELGLLFRRIAIKELDTTAIRDWWSELPAILPDCFFLLAIHLTRKTVLFTNDELARLPVYIVDQGHSLFIGRDIGLAKASCPSVRLNPLYLALYQVFCYVPGRGTYFDEIDTLPGASIGAFNWERGQLILVGKPELRFPESDPAGSQRRRLAELATRFETVIRGYKLHGNNVLALSGGFDSRVIAAAMTRRGVAYEAATYRDAARSADDDSRIADQIVSILKCPHQTFILNRESEQNYKRLFHVKAGLNYLGMAFFLEFLDVLSQNYPEPMVLITGDGGDKVLPSQLPEIRLPDGSAWLDYLYAHQAYFSPQVAAETFGIRKRALDDYLLELASSYPAKSFTYKYKQFLLAERAGRWLFEGEDRNRAHFASVTPFYDMEFYRLALRIPDQWKQGNAFYSLFLRRIAPEISRIRLANSRVIPGYLSSGIYRSLLEILRMVRHFRTKPQAKPPGIPAFPMQDWMIGKIGSGCQDSGSMRNMFNCSRINDPSFLKGLDITQLRIMLTLGSVINEAMWD